MPTKHRGHQDRTLQDDRTELGIDIGDESPLVTGEGAPLADDAVVGTDAAAGTVLAPAFLGGAPIPAPIDVDPDRSPGRDPMTAAKDKPIDD